MRKHLLENLLRMSPPAEETSASPRPKNRAEWRAARARTAKNRHDRRVIDAENATLTGKTPTAMVWRSTDKRVLLWHDPAASEEGDGSRDRPFRDQAVWLAAIARTHAPAAGTS